MLVLGNRFGLLFLIAIIALIYYTTNISKKVPLIRKFPAIAGIEEAIGRSAEMGRPVHASPGTGSMISQYGTETICGLAAINYAARLAAEKGTEFICSVAREDHITPATESIRNGYLKAGKLNEFNESIVRYAPYGPAFDVSVMGTAKRDRPGANICIGPWHHPSLFLIEVMASVGAMNIGGTTRIAMAPFFVGACNYALIGEEVMVVGAVLSEDEKALGSIVGQDYLKYLVMLTIFLGIILSSIGVNIITQIMTW